MNRHCTGFLHHPLAAAPDAGNALLRRYRRLLGRIDAVERALDAGSATLVKLAVRDFVATASCHLPGGDPAAIGSAFAEHSAWRRIALERIGEEFRQCDSDGFAGLPGSLWEWAVEVIMDSHPNETIG